MMSARQASRLGLGLLVGALGLGAIAPTAMATFLGDNGRLAFTESSGDRDGESDLFTIAPNGGQGSFSRSILNSPHWRPDGYELVFVDDVQSEADDCGDYAAGIFFAYPGESGARRLAVSRSTNPAWSPSGERVVFARYVATVVDQSCRYASEGLWSSNVDGSDLKRLTDGVGDVLGPEPEWSPSGESIVFTRDAGIFSIARDGSRLRQLTSDRGSQPSWSPDGRRIAFSSPRDGNDNVYAMNADGTGQTRLTSDPAQDSEPVWAPDGLSIGFRRGERDIFYMDPSGRTQRRAFTGTCAIVDRCQAEDPSVLKAEGLDWQPLAPGSNLLLNPSFDSNTAGWGSFQGQLTREAVVSPSGDGVVAARVVRASGDRYSISDSQGGHTATIPFTAAGQTYVGAGYVRAASSSAVGKPISLILREQTATGTVKEWTASTTLSDDWKRLAASARVTATGNRLGIRLEQRSAAAGHAFHADDLNLVRSRPVLGAGAAGSLWTPMTAGAKRATPFKAEARYEISGLRAYLDGKGAGSGSQVVRGVIYADANGAPAERRATIVALTIPAGRAAGWVDLAIPSLVTVGANGTYWLGLHSGTTSKVARWAGTAKTGALRFNTDAYADGAAGSFGAASTDDKEMSIQAIGG